MGATYGTISIKGPTQEALANWLRSENVDAFVTSEENGWTTFSDQETDQLDTRWIESFLQRLTRDLMCVGIAVTVYDEEQLYLLAAQHGVLESRYNSCPGMTMDDPGPEDMRPRLEDAPALLATIGRQAESDDLLRILGMDGAKDYIDPLELHEELATYLGLPESSVGLSHRYVLRHRTDLSEQGLIRTVDG